jgi:outer membrane protein assembly factor BamA
MKTMIRLFCILLISFTFQGAANGEISAPADSIPKKARRFDVFPAITYSPETQLTLGGIGYYYMDLSREGKPAKLSNINFLAVYTTAKQTAIELRAEIFTPGNKWRIRGETFFNHWPDRNYGAGNDASVLLQVRDDSEWDTVNYLSYTSDRLKFAPAVIREIAPNLFVGLNVDLEYLYNVSPLPDAYDYLGLDAARIEDLPIAGMRSGIGMQLLYDSRDNVLNPLKGTYAEFSELHYMKALGSDFDFNSFRLDVRQFINTTKNHTLALRAVANLRYSGSAIPIRGLSRVGGRSFLRGYFIGTYQDNHLLGFEGEYRLPFWKEDTQAPLIQFWKRLGLVVFAGTAQVAPELSDFSANRFHTAVGGGLRILFNRDSRVNLRIDYAQALHPDSAGPGKRQSGLYFFLSEAF